jgi:hypothetical protein
MNLSALEGIKTLSKIRAQVDWPGLSVRSEGVFFRLLYRHLFSGQFKGFGREIIH